MRTRSFSLISAEGALTGRASVTSASEQRLTLAQVAELLAKLEELDIVLIGGQALNYWCSRYEGRIELGAWLPASRDIDFQGAKTDVEICAQKVGGDAETADIDGDANHIGYVVAPGGVIIDFIGVPLGLKDWAEVQEGALAMPIPVPDREAIRLRVMNPIQCLRSRAHNVVRMPDKYDNEHGVAQLQASMQCAREFIIEMLDAAQTRFALEAVKAIYWLTRKQVGVDLYSKKRIDLYDSVPPVMAEWVGAQQQAKMQSAIERSRAARARLVQQNGPAARRAKRNGD